MAKISVSCKSCGKRYGVPETYAGKRFKCKDCGAAVQVPAPEEPEPAVDEPDFEDEPPAPKKRKATRGRPGRGRPAGGRRRAQPAEEEEEEEAAPARGARGGSARGRRTARAGGRRGRTAHGHDDDDHGYGRRGPNEPSKALVYGSAGISVLIILLAIVYFGFLHNPGQHPVKKKKKRRDAAAEESGFARKEVVANPEDEDPGFGDPEPEKEPEPEKKPEPKPEPKEPEKKAEPEKPKEEKLAPIPRADIRKVAHYDATSDEQKSEIDDAVEAMTDPWGGAKANRAMAKIVKIGKPAVPALLSAMVGLDFQDEEERTKMPMITSALKDLTKTPVSYVCRVGMMGNDRKEIWNCEFKRAQWFEWWDRYGKGE